MIRAKPCRTHTASAASSPLPSHSTGCIPLLPLPTSPSHPHILLPLLLLPRWKKKIKKHPRREKLDEGEALRHLLFEGTLAALGTHCATGRPRMQCCCVPLVATMGGCRTHSTTTTTTMITPRLRMSAPLIFCDNTSLVLLGRLCAFFFFFDRMAKLLSISSRLQHCLSPSFIHHIQSHSKTCATPLTP